MPPLATTFNLIFVQCILLCMPAMAESAARIRLPLGGYYRAGESMPVIIEATGDSPAIRISGLNVIPVEVPAGWSGVLPVLVLAERAEQSLVVEQADENAEHLPLHPLAADQRLIGVVYHGAPMPPDLFDGSSLVAVDITEADARSMTLVPSNTLDGIVIEQPDLKAIPAFLSAGVSVIVPGDIARTSAVAWKKAVGYSILHAPSFGPASAIGGESAYLPTQSWLPGVSATLRHQILLVAILVSLLFAASLLLRRALLQFIAITAVALLACAAIAVWRRGMGSVDSMSGNVLVRADELVQLDHWTYMAAGPSGSETISEGMQPVLVDANQATSIGLKVVAREGDGFGWSFKLPPNGRLALRSRSVLYDDGSSIATNSESSPLYELARQCYLGPGMEISGYVSTLGMEWGTILVGRDGEELNIKRTVGQTQTSVPPTTVTK